MKSETEISKKLDAYRTMFNGLKAGGAISNPEIFLTLSAQFPEEAIGLLGSSARAEMVIAMMPPEDRSWVRQWFGSLAVYARQVLEARISILDWVLEKESVGEGVTGGCGK
jgi:hypothetical protein